ncbi:MAG TPA: patatin-like phospholipase family protein [Acidimicrobiales bacterium]|nr:patatin-like phospholipase family protein [Acidimicrobiales bacterium]
MPTVALVLGAGGVTGGAFHAGVLAALAETTGWDPRSAALVVGTSAGAATGAALRAGLPAPDLAARALGDQLSEEGRDVLRRAGAPVAPPPVPRRPRARLGPPAGLGALAGALRRPWRVRPGAVLAGLLPAGSVPTDDISGGIGALHPAGWPAASLWVCAVRLDDGALVVFGRDPSRATVGEAVAASCAIPGWFAPVEIDGARYVDGGAHSFTNVAEVAPQRPDLVVVSSPLSRYGPGRAQLALEVQRVRRRNIPVVTFEPTGEVASAMGANAMDPSRRPAVVRAARTMARRRVEDLGDRLSALG